MAVDLAQQFAAVRKHYKALLPLIKRADLWADDDAYAWDRPSTGITMTPIEAALWQDIRQVGVVLYPQLPVGRYFVDFGNPIARVAVECDGQQWHRDAERDAKRQHEIEGMGWTVYRISGRECLADLEELLIDGKLKRAPSAAHKLIRHIADAHGLAYGMGS